MNQPLSRARSNGLNAYLKTKMPVLGIDLGGTKLSCALVSDCRVLGEAVTVATPHGPDKIVEAILALIQQFQEKTVFAGVGIATAGIVDCVGGNILGSTPNIDGWTGVSLKHILEARTMLPVHVDNDGNAAIYGDMQAMGLRNKVCVIGVTIGTGIGAGIVINGRPYRGAAWAAGEVGHMRIALDNTRLCTCGMYDCWEEYGSGRGMIKTCKELLNGITSEQSSLAQDPAAITTRTIVAAAQAGDIIAQKAVARWHEHLSVGLVCLAYTLNPDSFILSGGLSEVIDYDLLTDLVKDRCLPVIADVVEIRKSALGKHAGIIGAAQVVLDGIIPGAKGK